MPRDPLTPFLRDNSPERFVVFEERRWLMAPADKEQDHSPALLMDLREIEGPIEEVVLDPDDRNLRVALRLAEMGGLPFIVLAFPAGTRITDETDFKVFRVEDTDPFRWPEGDVRSAGAFREEFFPGGGGARKAINVQLANEFQRWQRSTFPDSLVFHDVDALIVEGTQDLVSEPKAVLEHKQSFYGPERWNQEDFMSRDANNYLALVKLGEATSTIPCTVYHTKNLPVNDDTAIGVFRITNVDGPSVSRNAAFTTVGRFRENPSEFL